MSHNLVEEVFSRTNFRYLTVNLCRYWQYCCLLAVDRCLISGSISSVKRLQPKFRRAYDFRSVISNIIPRWLVMPKFYEDNIES